MPWLMFVLGSGLAGAGGWAVLHGYPYMQLEFGWTEVIAGTTALSGGIVTIAVGAVLQSLARLRQTLERSAVSPAPRLAASTSPVIAVEPPAPPETIVPEQKPVAFDEPKVVKAAGPEDTRERVTARPADSPRRARSPISATSSKPTPPTIAGRYESGGSSYVLFSDGTIEVESETGKRRFGSMDELKSFMAQEKPETLAPEAVR